MNTQQRKNGSVLARAWILIIFAVFCKTAAAIDFPAKADTATPANIECVLNWAQTFHPKLFSPMVTGVQSFPPFTYRYYADTNSYLAVSSADNHVYYLRSNDASLLDIGDLSVWLKESGCGAVPYPVIFVHGIASTADTWAMFRDYLINNAGWVFGGIPAYDTASQTVKITCPSGPNQQVSCTGKNGNFYTLNFSDSQHLSFDAQGSELEATITAVLEANPGTTKVLLVSHSMGSLAAREYLQGLAKQPNADKATPYRDDVAKLITVGAPHQGSFWAEQCNNHFDVLGVSGNIGICSLLSLDIDPNSVAIEDLQPGSSALAVLNDLAAHPLPANVAYVSIIGTGQQTLSKLVDFEDGDGIVPATSQDLATVAGNQSLQHKAVKIDVVFRDCGKKISVSVLGDIGQTHTCETSDPGVGAEILRDLQ
ncbi:MAG: esterase/lipase family protein [Methylobacter sp.]